MSIVDSLKNGAAYQLASNANITIKSGDGNSNINVTGANVNIDTGCGDQNINVVASGNVKVDTGLCGFDNVNVVAGGNAKIKTMEDDDNIQLVCGGNFDIDAGVNYNEFNGVKFTDNDTINVMSSSTTGQNHISTGNDNDVIKVIANNVDIDKNAGTMLLGAIGNNYDVDSYNNYV